MSEPRRLLLVASLLLAGGIAVRALPGGARASLAEDPAPPPPPTSIASITPADALRHVTFLASPKLEGRGSGFPGADEAARYLAEQLRASGLEPYGDPIPGAPPRPVPPAGSGSPTEPPASGGSPPASDPGRTSDGSAPPQTPPSADAPGDPGTAGATEPARAFEQVFEVSRAPFPGQPTGEEDDGSRAKTANVVGLVRGSDPVLRNEFLVLSAHYDHVGKRGKKRIFHGADDNASGTAALLEVAQALSRADAPRPRRSVLILHCSGEERGLLGSEWFVAHSPVPVGKIVANLNIDMVGRNAPGKMDVYGNGTSPDLDRAHLEAAKRSGLQFTPRIGSIFRRSDQVNFYLKDIPCLFFTSGLHKDYHTPDDTAAKIDEGKVAKAALHTYLTAWTVANRTERPAFRKLDENASSGPLGAVLDAVPAGEVPTAKLAAGQGICVVRSVLDGTPAAEAKLQPGDLISGIGEDPLPEDDPVGSLEGRLGELKGKGKTTLRVLRGRTWMKISVKL